MAQATQEQAPAPTKLTPPANDIPSVDPVPETWPGAFGAYKHSKAAVMTNLWTIIALIVLNIVISGVIQAIGGRNNTFAFWIAELASLFFSMVLIYVYIAGVRKQAVSVGDAFKKIDFKTFLFFLLNSILLGVIAVFSFLLLIVPFFIIMPRLIFAPYFVLDKKLDPIEALRASWTLTPGNVGKVWGVIGASLAMGLLFLTIIGIPFAIYFLFMYGASTIVLYEYLNRHPAAPAPAAAEGPVTQS